MAVTAFLYANWFNSMAASDVDVDADTFKVMLTTSAYTPAQDTHDFKDDVTNEVVGTGYTATGDTLTGVTWGYTAGTNTWKFDANDTTWATSTITARYAVIYDVSTGGSDATRRLVGYVDFGGDQTTNSADFVIQWNAAGIWTLTVA